MENEKKLSTEETEKNIDPINDMDTLNALLFDSESGDDADYHEAEIEFDAFIAEYRDLISKTLADAAIEREQREAAVESGDDEQTAFHPNAKPQGKADPVNESKDIKSDWHNEITLLPEEYDESCDEEEPIVKDEAKEAEPDNDLGSVIDDADQFQISINFDGEQAQSASDAEEKATRKYDPDNPRLIDWIFDIAEIFTFVLAAVMIISMFIFRPSTVEGGSMLTTLEDGDQLIISNLFYTPKRNDIIVFEDYTTSLKKAVVKRVIGLPGETVEIKQDDKGGLIILIDDKQIEDEYGYYASSGELKGCEPITLGENEIFVMGDNRRNSTDSRYPAVGTVSTDAILGKVIFRFLPFDKLGTIK